MGEATKSLAARMCEAQSDVGWVKKNGTNDHFNYKFATESDIADACRAAMKAHGIGMFYLGVIPESVSINGNAYSALFRYKFVNTDNTEDHFEVTAWGFATDRQDKGPPKAMTSAHKYMLIRTFNISTGDVAEDPDAGGEEVRPAARKPAKPAAPVPALPEATPTGDDLDDDKVYLAKCLEVAGIEDVKEAKRVLTNLAIMYGAGKPSDFKGLNRHRFIQAIREGA